MPSELIRAFGINAHHLRDKVSVVYSEITGLPVGKVRETGDGRVSALARPETVRVRVADFMDLNTFRERIYEEHRQMGYTYDEAVHKLFPNHRIKA